MTELTPKQIAFLKKYLKVPKLFGRKEAKARRAEWAREFAAFNGHRDAVTAMAEGVKDSAMKTLFKGRIAEAEDIVMRSIDRPDFEGGHAHLDQVDHAIKVQILYENCAAEIEKLRPLTETTLSGGPSNQAEIRMVWNYIREKAEQGRKSGSHEDLRSALAAVPKLEALLKACDTVSEEDRKKIDEQAGSRASRGDLDAQAARFAVLQTALKSAFGGDVPPDLSDRYAAIEAALDVNEDAAQKDIVAAAKTAADLITALDDAAAPIKEKRNTYEQKLTALEGGPRAILTGHRAAGEALLQPAMAALEASLKGAAAKARAHDYDDAIEEVDRAAVTTRELIRKADALIEFLDLRADRQQRIDAMTAKVTDPDWHAALRASYDKALDLWKKVTDAFASNALEKILAARPHLEEVPRQVDETLQCYKLADYYVWYYKQIKDEAPKITTKIAGFDVVEKEAIEELRDQFAALVTECAAEADLRIAHTKAERAHSLLKLINGKINEITGYAESKKAFEKRLSDMEAVTEVDIKAAIAEYLGRLKGDLTHAVSRIVKRDFAMARRVYDSSADTHPVMEKLIADARAYFADKKGFEDNIARVKGLTRADAAVEGIAEAEALKAQADTAKGAKDWASAAQFAAAARKRLEAAETEARSAKDLDDAKNGADAAINGMKKDDIAAAEQIYAKVRGVAVAQACDTTSPFDQYVTAGDTKRDEARAAAGADNIPEAQAKIREAIREVEETLDWKLKWDAFGGKYNAEKRRYDALKAEKDGGWKAGPLFDTELGEIDTNLTGGWDDFSNNWPPQAASAETKLRDAAIAIDHVTRLKDPAGAAREAKTTIDGYMPKINSAWASNKEPTEVASFKTDQTAFDGKFTAKDYDTAGKDGPPLARRGLGVVDLAEQHYWYDKNVTDELNPALANLPATDVFCKAEKARVAEMQAEIRKLADAHAYLAARRMIFSLKWLVETCNRLETEGAAYKPVRDAAKAAIDGLRAKVDGRISGGEVLDAFQELCDTFDSGEDHAKGQHFKDAQERMQKVVDDAAALKPRVDAFDAYMTARDAAGAELARIGKLPEKGPVQPLVARVMGKHDNAVKLGDGGDYATAKSMFEDLARECVEALKAAARFNEYEDLADKVGDMSDEDAEGLSDALRQAEGFIEPLGAHPEALFAFEEIGKANAALDQARSLEGSDPAKAREKLKEVLAICKTAQLQLGHFTQLRQSADFATATMRDFLASHPQAGFVRSPIEEHLVKIDKAMMAVRTRPDTREACVTIIEEALAAFHPLRLAADRQIEVEKLIAGISSKIAEMERHSHRYAIADDIDAVRAGLGSARDAADKHDHERALDLLNAAQARQADALMEAQMEAGQVPDPAALKKLVESEGGAERLDELVRDLDPKVQRKVMTEVFKVRFGTELNLFKDSEFEVNELIKYLEANTTATAAQMRQAKRDMKRDDYITFLKNNSNKSEADIDAQTKDIAERADVTAEEYKKKKMEDFKNATPPPTPEQIAAREAEVEALTATLNFDMAPEEKAPNLRRFYELMSKLPDTATLDNDSLGLFTHKGGRETAPYYSGSQREVVMNGEESTSSYHTVGLANELGEVDEDSRPEPGEKLTLFSWNTLHEVGHAVDDKKGFMNSRGGDLAGWQEHGANVKPIADLIAEKYDYDADYIAEYMGGNANPPIPAPEPGVEDHDWELRRANARAHVDNIRSDAESWQTDQAAKACVLKGRCYHEAYGGGRSWVSYPYSARAKGVSGYQFRAPGEWFSELYAAYHSGKMNANHPARKWLDTL